jgi:hypothetical protein
MQNKTNAVMRYLDYELSRTRVKTEDLPKVLGIKFMRLQILIIMILLFMILKEIIFCLIEGN